MIIEMIIWIIISLISSQMGLEEIRGATKSQEDALLANLDGSLGDGEGHGCTLGKRRDQPDREAGILRSS